MKISPEDFIKKEMTPEIAIEHLGKLNVWRLDGQMVHKAFTKAYTLYIDYAGGKVKVEPKDSNGHDYVFDIKEYERKLRDYVKSLGEN